MIMGIHKYKFSLSCIPLVLNMNAVQGQPTQYKIKE